MISADAAVQYLLFMVGEQSLGLGIAVFSIRVSCCFALRLGDEWGFFGLTGWGA